MRARLIFFCALTLILIFYAVILRSAGTWLVKDDMVVNGDAIIVLMGNIPDRVLETVDIYEKGYGNKVLVVEENMGAYKELRERGADIISNTRQFCMAAFDLGISPDDIVILPGQATSTQMESTIIRDYLKAKPHIDTLLLVSSASHTRRAAMIFKSAFNKAKMPVTVVSCPSQYSGFNAAGWWKNREDIQKVLLEYLKIANFLVFDRHNL
ncbi:MAG TPA: YdcF family protein [Bacteroidetes bacterium]|nr:YdcF family protein [Bacteroidota bacterium]